MTLSNTPARVSYAGNGAVTSFGFAFKIWAPSDLKVYLRDTATLVDTLQSLTTDYTVSVASYPGSGNVIFNTPPAAGRTVVILRDAAATQDLDLIANGAFAAENVEIALDKIAGYVQALEEQAARAPLLPVGTTLSNLALPEPTPAKAGRAIGINNTGDGFIDIAASIASAAVTSFVATLLDDASAQVFLGSLGFLSGSATWNPGSISDNASVSTSVTVTGAAVGDFVLSVSASGDIATTANVVLSGKVSATNTATVQLQNDSGGAFDAASQTIYVVVLKKSSMGL